MSSEATVVLKPISSRAAEALAAGRAPDVAVAPGYPTEFSAGVGQAARAAGAAGLGPFFIHRLEDDVVVGEIGAAFVADGTVEIGYAIVPSVWGRGHATEAVRAMVELARRDAAIARVVANTPVDRPASGRVVEKAGFVPAGEHVDEHEGQAIRVIRWELPVRDASLNGRSKPGFWATGRWPLSTPSLTSRSPPSRLLSVVSRRSGARAPTSSGSDRMADRAESSRARPSQCRRALASR